MSAIPSLDSTISPFLKQANLGSFSHLPTKTSSRGHMTTWAARLGELQTHIMVWVSTGTRPKTGAVLALQYARRQAFLPLVALNASAPLREVFRVAAEQQARLLSTPPPFSPMIPTRHALPVIADWVGRPKGWATELSHVDEEPLWLSAADAVLDSVQQKTYVGEIDVMVRSLEQLEAPFSALTNIPYRIALALEGNPDRQHAARMRVLRLNDQPNGTWLRALQPTLRAFFEISQ